MFSKISNHPDYNDKRIRENKLFVLCVIYPNNQASCFFLSCLFKVTYQLRANKFESIIVSWLLQFQDVQSNSALLGLWFNSNQFKSFS